LILTETPLAGAFLVQPDLREDERGFFARTFCHRVFAEHGLDPAVAQCSLSFNHRQGTVRGLHYQAEPHVEAKLVRCTRGAIFDVIVDMRAGSATRGSWFGAELNWDNRNALFVPAGFAHGFQTLTDDAEVFYQISTDYVAGAACGVRFDDPDLGIVWPGPVTVISERDRNLPLFEP
jgi:dTDP-4-dehydrorhamnose 3,5-epimerase